MSKTWWVVITLVLVGGFTALVMAYGAVGVLVAILGSVLFFVGLDRLYRWRSNRLLRSMNPGERLVASGLVSEQTYDETAAALVRDDANRYRLLVADSRGATSVASVTSTLTGSGSPYDQRRYIELETDKGTMHFAPRRGLSAAAQAQHAQDVLDSILIALPPTLPLNGA